MAATLEVGAIDVLPQRDVPGVSMPTQFGEGWGRGGGTAVEWQGRSTENRCSNAVLLDGACRACLPWKKTKVPGSCSERLAPSSLALRSEVQLRMCPLLPQRAEKPEIAGQRGITQFKLHLHFPSEGYLTDLKQMAVFPLGFPTPKELFLHVVYNYPCWSDVGEMSITLVQSLSGRPPPPSHSSTGDLSA